MYNKNENTSRVTEFGQKEPRHIAIREAIKEEKKENREPVLMGSNRKFLHSSGRTRQIMMYGPRRESLYNGDPCPECGYEFDQDEWDCREVAPGAPTVGQIVNFTCPRCDRETCSICQ